MILIRVCIILNYKDLNAQETVRTALFIRSMIFTAPDMRHVPDSITLILFSSFCRLILKIVIAFAQRCEYFADNYLKVIEICILRRLCIRLFSCLRRLSLSGDCCLITIGLTEIIGYRLALLSSNTASCKRQQERGGVIS